MIEHINELIAGRPVDIPIYDYTQHTRSEKTYRQEPQDVFIVEGILVLEDKRLRDLMDIKLFVDTDDDIRIIRRIKRDMEERGRSWIVSLSNISVWLNLCTTSLSNLRNATQMW